MNILFIAQRIPYPANKGEKIRTFHQIKYLADLGHNITVLCPYENEEEQSFALQLSQFNNISCQCIPLGPKSLRLLSGLVKNESLSVANFYNKKLQNRIDSLIESSSFNALICTSSAVAKYIFCSTTLVKQQVKPMLLMDFMDLDSDKWQQYANTSNWPMKWIYQRESLILAKYEQEIVRQFKASFFIADAEVNLFQAKSENSKNVHVLGNGMDTNTFFPAKEAPENEQPIFLFTGVMDYKPNVDAVIWFVKNIWPSVVSEYPKAKFIIAGMNPSSAVKELVKIAGIEVTGFVEDILPYYHQSDYFIAPFRLARGVQNKVLQAFACGLPVIATPMGAEGIDCSDKEDILLANNKEEFLTSISLLESDHKLKMHIKDNALRLISEKYSWEGKLQVLDNILQGS